MNKFDGIDNLIGSQNNTVTYKKRK